ncbi:unnamed protein product [Rotaria magnacalcarata]|uniref:Tetratricopeptide repeat protein n=2 Tax=Rotaria magnacalcarata TaxID=392030 RepID=A0A815RRE9_9BILA|nr:unnamed protein product [Rotaria magnacalcarata]CAF3971046.1 unnamed protein product [Rotaria magnacalcarata]
MTIDPSKTSTSITPFAMIDKHSALPQEQEILFTMHSVFRIVEITPTPSNSRLWEVQLTITDESDPQLSTLTNRIKEEVQGPTGWHRMGKLMLKVGHFDQAEQLYDELLKGASDDRERVHIYHQLACARIDRGEYREATEFLENSLKVHEQILSPNDPELTTIKALPEKHPNLAITHSNKGDVHRLIGDYEKALAFHQKALNIQENVKCNPLECATTYMNLGETYREMTDYTTALTYYQKGLKIREEKLAKTHPDLAVIYHNMLKLYFSTEKYSMPMKYIQQAVEIGQEKLPTTHPHLVEYRETYEKIRKKQ